MDNQTKYHLRSTAALLISRLERLSADSYWAHQASGIRGSLLRCLEQLEAHESVCVDLTYCGYTHLSHLLHLGFKVLENAAREIRPPRRWSSG